MRALALTLSATLLATGGVAVAGKRAVPVAVENGTPRSCLPLSQIRESRVRSDSIIDFRTNGNKWYRNTLPQSCPSLGFEQRFSYKTSLSQLCSVDIISVLRDIGGHLDQGPSCGLGKFQPVDLVKTAGK